MKTNNLAVRKCVKASYFKSGLSTLQVQTIKPDAEFF